MEDMTFEELLEINCFAEETSERIKAADLLEQRYCCEIRKVKYYEAYISFYSVLNGHF